MFVGEGTVKSIVRGASNPFTLLSSNEVIGGRTNLSKEEVSDRVFGFCGQAILSAGIPNRHQWAERASMADWECLQVENPDRYYELARQITDVMAEFELEAPSHLTYPQEGLASVHSLDESRQNRTDIPDAASLAVSA